MGRCALDNLPEWKWFLGLDLRSAALVIATLGIMHPTAYLYTCFIYRSYLFLTIWVLTSLWAVFSVWLFVGIMIHVEVPYETWVWFTLVFVWVMVALMIILLSLCSSCTRDLDPHACEVIVPSFGILYYCLTFYMIFVVNSHRMAAFPSNPSKSTDE